jgi:hypothetical protein
MCAILSKAIKRHHSLEIQTNYIFEDTIGRIIKFYRFLQMRGASFDRKLSWKPPINFAIIIQEYT